MPVSPETSAVRACGRQPSDQLEDVLHGLAAADHSAELGVPRRIALELQQRAALVGFGADGGQQLTQPLQVERLGEVVDRRQA